MKKINSIIIFFVFISINANAQYKPVQIKKEGIYVNYYYKLKQTEYKKNDSIYYLCKTISSNTFCLEKYINKSMVSKTKFKLVLAKDSLSVYERKRIPGQKTKIEKTKQPYYIGIELKH